MDNIRHHNFDIERDVFFFEDGYIKEMYFNPDSSAGGSIVENIITFCQFLSAAKNGYSEDIWSNLEGDCRHQFIYDVDTESFPYYLDIFQKDGDASGATEKTFNKILEYIHSIIQSPTFLFQKDKIIEYVYTSGTVIRYDHRLADVLLHYEAVKSPSEFFERLHSFSKREEDDSALTFIIADKKTSCDYNKETMEAMALFAKGALKEQDSIMYSCKEKLQHIAATLDSLNLEWLIINLRRTSSEFFDLYKSDNKGCCYCTPSETGYCTDVFSDPESAMEVSLSVGDGAVDINVKFADGREGRLATTARYCPYCGRKIR